MVTQYPYLLSVYDQQESVYDETAGTWVTPESDWVELGKCRDEISTPKTEINPDGSEITYSAMIFCPRSTPLIKSGAKVRVTEKDGTIRLEKDIVRFKREQLHSRIWL